MNNELLANINKLHTTELGAERIKRNLGVDVSAVVNWCRQRILTAADITRRGKNWYVHSDNCIITVNAHSYTIITAHKENLIKRKSSIVMPDNIEICIVKENKKRLLPLLLLGDEQESQIDKYLERGDLFALYDGDVKSVCVVTDEGDGVLEIQNLATDEQNQQRGYASRLIEYIVLHYSKRYKKIILGTGDVSGILKFYEHRGFSITHRLPDYFTTHYDHPIIEDGVLLKDKVYLAREL